MATGASDQPCIVWDISAMTTFLDLGAAVIMLDCSVWGSNPGNVEVKTTFSTPAFHYFPTECFAGFLVEMTSETDEDATPDGIREAKTVYTAMADMAEDLSIEATWAKNPVVSLGDIMSVDLGVISRWPSPALGRRRRRQQQFERLKGWPQAASFILWKTRQDCRGVLDRALATSCRENARARYRASATGSPPSYNRRKTAGPTRGLCLTEFDSVIEEMEDQMEDLSAYRRYSEHAVGVGAGLDRISTDTGIMDSPKKPHWTTLFRGNMLIFASSDGIAIVCFSTVEAANVRVKLMNGRFLNGCIVEAPIAVGSETVEIFLSLRFVWVKKEDLELRMRRGGYLRHVNQSRSFSWKTGVKTRSEDNEDDVDVGDMEELLPADLLLELDPPSLRRPLLQLPNGLTKITRDPLLLIMRVQKAGTVLGVDNSLLSDLANKQRVFNPPDY
ncbi:hypothetical protein BU16DRAFT_535518 [Lophium mytilinum]|uniref:Uncharacterized protein n=1 Tax=Lophium mytilinum TaxID=390894 RepID=A0A6A6R5W3_9PEZI|nr:hypothetical protein BU16DRAFT_535518 [Lophium mytilinum]